MGVEVAKARAIDSAPSISVDRSNEEKDLD